MSNVMACQCQMSWHINVKYQMSNVKCHINVKCQISWHINVKYHGISMSWHINVKCHGNGISMSNVKCHTLNIKSVHLLRSQ